MVFLAKGGAAAPPCASIDPPLPMGQPNNGDGIIDFDEFKRMMKGVTQKNLGLGALAVSLYLVKYS
ncbi:unnamed protein product [Prunus armeniaca]